MILMIRKLKQLFDDTKSIQYIILFYLGCEENLLYCSIKHLHKTMVTKKGASFFIIYSKSNKTIRQQQHKSII